MLVLLTAKASAECPILRLTASETTKLRSGDSDAYNDFATTKKASAALAFHAFLTMQRRFLESEGRPQTDDGRVVIICAIEMGAGIDDILGDGLQGPARNDLSLISHFEE